MRLWINRYNNDGNINHNPGAGRPRMIQGEPLDNIMEEIEEFPFRSTRTMAQEYGCSMRTIRNTLHRAGIHHRIPARKIALTEENKAARVRFAREFRDFDFSHSIFSDEKTFKSSQIGKVHLWRRNGTRYDPSHTIKTQESGRIHLNMWGWMSADGPGELVVLPGRTTGEIYRDVLETCLRPSVRIIYPREEVPLINYFQDNAPIHRARVVQSWFDENQDIINMPWPSRSPDLNPIENLWAKMVNIWENENERTRDALQHHCIRVWDSLRGTQICQNLVLSMRSRCDAVIAAEGEMTKY